MKQAPFKRPPFRPSRPIPLDAIPGYTEAVERETVNRVAAFLPITENIGPFEALPFNLTHLAMLQMVDSPLLRQKPPDVVELMQFLWIVSPDYSPKWSLKKVLFFWKCRRKLVVQSPLTDWFVSYWAKRSMPKIQCAALTSKAALDYIREAFADAQRGGISQGKEHYSDCAYFCAALGREYGMSIKESMTTPLKVVLQLMKERRQWHQGKDARLYNESDRILNDWLIKQNQKVPAQ